MSLFRLKTARGSGPLQPVSDEEYVAGATQEQSMGRPGYNALHEVLVPLDADALLCVDTLKSERMRRFEPFCFQFDHECHCRNSNSVRPT